MKKVLITGARGFLGRNLTAHLKTMNDVELLLYDIENNEEELGRWLALADVVFHLAGINRPRNVKEYETGNAGFTKNVCKILRQLGRKPKIIMSSSIQAEQDNPYGKSKRRAEESLKALSRETGTPVSIYRLKNVFGKWCRANYNSVTATFCHNIAGDLPITILDPRKEIELVYVDDVVARFVEEMNESSTAKNGLVADTIPSTRITLGEMAGRIQAFHEMKRHITIPDFSHRFNQQLYATYLSYVSPDALEHGLEIKADSRGNLAEFIKSRHLGQIFVSRTRPGITRGNHYHHTKTEKFLVLTGHGLIRMRHIESDDVVEYRVYGEDYHVIDIPPGYTHSITNVGEDEMVTLFWASEIFNPDRPDTYYMDVDRIDHVAGRR